MKALFDQGQAPACPQPFNMAAYVLAQADRLAAKPALEVLGASGSHVLSYNDLARRVRQMATGLVGAGIAPGARLLMRLGNTVDFPITYLGAIHAGIVPVPTSAQLTSPEITTIAADLRPQAIVAAPGIALPEGFGGIVLDTSDLRGFDSLAQAPATLGDANRPAYIIYTSGTGGRARGVVHAHRAIWARRMMWRDWYDLRPDDRLLHAGAFNWTYTMGTGLMDPWAMGATALIAEPGTPPAQLGPLLARHGATIFAATPGVYRQVLHQPLPPLPALRHGLSAGEKLPEAAGAAWHEATGTHIYEAFGMSECSTFISGAPGTELPAGALGRVQTGRRVAILESAGNKGAQIAPLNTPGTIAIARSDPGLMLGYLDAPEDTRARFRGDWFVTGDHGAMDENGAITYLGREDDMLNAGGFRVSPLEIETALRSLPGLSDCAAIEVEVKADTRVIAACYCAPEPIPEDRLRAHAAQRLARYKQPRLYFHLAELPRNPNGKLLRRSLRETISSRS